RMADWLSARTLWATSTPAAPSVATPAAPPPFIVWLSASTSRAIGVLAANTVVRTGNRSPQHRAGPRSIRMNPRMGYPRTRNRPIRARPPDCGRSPSRLRILQPQRGGAMDPEDERLDRLD